MLVALVTFVVVLALILGPYAALVLWPERQTVSALRNRLRISPQRVSGSLTLEDPEPRLSHIEPLNQLLERAPAISRLDAWIKQAGLSLSPGVIVLSSAVTMTLAGLVGRLTVPPVFAVAAALVGAVLPVLAVRKLRARQFAQFEEQFPEAVELLARSLRAGHALPAGLKLVAEEMPAPLSEQFKLLHDQHSFGMPLPEALRGLAERVPLIDTRFFVTAVLTQRETGGNLAEVLDNLAAVIRDRFKVKRQVRVATAHARTTGWILAALPPVLAMLTTFVLPEHMRILIDDPLGPKLIFGAVCMQAIGTLIIRKMVNIPY